MNTSLGDVMNLKKRDHGAGVEGGQAGRSPLYRFDGPCHGAGVGDERAERLAAAAALARRRAYAPYSGFRVGAALLARDGRIFTGCNVENAAYTPSICAERTAFSKAVSEGCREFDAICIVGGAMDPPEAPCSPCGVCLQVMMEFCDPEAFLVILAGKGGRHEAYLLKELLPRGFGPANLNRTPG